MAGGVLPADHICLKIFDISIELEAFKDFDLAFAYFIRGKFFRLFHGN